MRNIVKFMASFLAVLFLAGIAFSQNEAKAKKAPENVKYAEMTNSEKRQFIENEVIKMLGLFRRVKGDEPTAKSIDQIKMFLDVYLRRSFSEKPKAAQCRFGDNLADVLKRGSAVAPIINGAFTKQDLPPQAGLYIAMIESEFCPCIQSPTGPLGMFQLTGSMAKEQGLNVIQGASPEKPDERCDPKKASQAGSAIFNDLLNTQFGRNSIGFPLSVAAFNAGQGSMKKNLKYVQAETRVEDVSFWLMSDYILEKNKPDESNENEEPDENVEPDEEFKGTKQFLYENSKYVPKFFAAAIVGENPRLFGFEMLPLSQVK